VAEPHVIIISIVLFFLYIKWFDFSQFFLMNSQSRYMSFFCFKSFVFRRRHVRNWKKKLPPKKRKCGSADSTKTATNKRKNNTIEPFLNEYLIRTRTHRRTRVSLEFNFFNVLFQVNLHTIKHTQTEEMCVCVCVCGWDEIEMTVCSFCRSNKSV
jgi:hypothetical protein